MLRKTKLALAAALILGAAGAAQAANDNQSDPTRGFAYGPMGQRVGGSAVNPIHHLSTRGKAHHAAPAEGAYAFAPGMSSGGSCEQRFKSFDPATGTYMGLDGARHPCK
jgi:hypothetical protein